MPTLGKFSRFEKQKSLNYATIFSTHQKSDEKCQKSSNPSSDQPSLNPQNLHQNASIFTKSINAHSNKVHSVSWSCDGSSLGSGSVDKTAAICKFRPGSSKMVKVATCKGHTSNVDQVVFSPIHPDIFSTAAHDKTVRFWDSRVKDCSTGDTEVTGALDSSLATASGTVVHAHHSQMTEVSSSSAAASGRESSNPPNKRSRTLAHHDEKGDSSHKHDSKDTKGGGGGGGGKSDQSNFEVLSPTNKLDTKGENINLSWSPEGNFLCVGNKYDLLSFIDIRSAKKLPLGAKKEKKKSPAIVASHAFKFEVNEFSWDTSGNIFTLTTGSGSVKTYDFKKLMGLPVVAGDNNILDLEPAYLNEFQAHSSNCICLDYDPTGKYFAVGSNDVLVSLWDAKNYHPIRTYSELAWPVRTLSFSHDAKLLAAASEDHFIDISLVEPIPGQLMWESESSGHFSSSTSGFGSTTISTSMASSASANLAQAQAANFGNVNGKYIDRFTMGESEQGDEFLVHSNKYLANRRTSSSVCKIDTGMPTFSVAWHPSKCILAYACDETDKDDGRSKSDSTLGNIRLFGIDLSV